MSHLRRSHQLKKILGAVLFAFLSLFVVITFVNYRTITSCDLADNEALSVVRNFTHAINLEIHEDWHSIDDSATLHNGYIRHYGWSFKNFMRDAFNIIESAYFTWGEPYKKIIYENYVFSVGCVSKEVVSVVVNSNEYQSIDVQLIGNVMSHSVTPPKKMIFKGFDSDNEKAYWDITLNGYKYYHQGLTINLGHTKKDDQTNKLISLHLWDSGTICSTNVHLTKDKALELAWSRFEKAIGKKWWKITGKGFFEIESVDIFIVRPKKLRLPFRENPSRLAWVIRFEKLGDPRLNKLKETFNDPKADSKERANARKAWDVESRKYRGIEYPSKIIIDAETGKAI